jgi:Secretion system C-terminal sorting domain
MKKMHYKQLLTVLILLVCSFAQSGGSGDDIVNQFPEYTRAICTDNLGNVYVASNISGAETVVDGVVVPTYNTQYFGYVQDGFIASYTCEGVLRWTKTIGGRYGDGISDMRSDAQGNIYVVGKLENTFSFEPGQYCHFDTDYILPNGSTETSFRQSLFIVKYNSAGVLQWLRFPQAADIYNAKAQASLSGELQVDAAGNSHWFTTLTTGVVGNGQYTVTNPPDPPIGYNGSNHVLKYDSNGNFVGGVPLPLDLGVRRNENFHFRRNPYNGNYFIVSGVTIGQGDEYNVYVNGQQVLHDKFLAAFAPNGSFLWKIENQAAWSNSYFTKDITFDAQNNIYFTGTIGATEISGLIPDGFNGLPLIATVNPFGFLYGMPFLIKLDPNGNTIWQTNGYGGASNHSVVLKNNEVAITGVSQKLVWENINYNFGGNGGNTNIIRLNKDTGTILGFYHLNNTTASTNQAYYITNDPFGNYYVGGAMNGSMDINNTTHYSNGGYSDFFIAKLGTNNCNFLGTEPIEKTATKMYPNPVGLLLYINNQEDLSFELFNSLGAKIQTGHFEKNAVLNVEALPKGVYLLSTKNDQGVIKIERIVKE